MKRTMLLLAATVLVICLGAGVALAQRGFGDQGSGVTKTCPTTGTGTTYPDTLIGTNAPNHIQGLGGNESPTWGDYIPGHGGNDILYGNAGGDRIEGGYGNDAIYGNQGKDLLIGGPDNDHINGGTGGDVIRVRDGYVDHVNCAGGNDDVSNRDRIDVLRNC